MPSRILAIHGVGDATRGVVIEELSRVLAPDPKCTWRYNDVVVAGNSFPALSGEESSPDLIEMNWADIQRPLSTPAGLVRYSLWLLFSLLHLGSRSPSRNGTFRRFATIYRHYFELVLFWSIGIPVHSLLLAGLGGSKRISAAVVFTLAIIAVTLLGRKASSLLRIGYVWAGSFSVISAYCIATSASLQYATISATVYATTQFIAIALLGCAAVETVCSFRNARYCWHARLAHLAFLYLPAVFVSCAGPVALAFCSTFIPDSPQVSEWEQTFKTHMGYDFVTAEIAMTISVALLPLILLLGVTLYFAKKEEARGKFAQKWLAFFLVAAPLILIANLALLIIQNGPMPIFATAELTFLEMYRYSALRALPVLPFLVGPLTVLLDILGDVVFYVLPRDHPLSTRTATQDRFLFALDIATSDDRDCTVFAHSQGSVIAVDALARSPRSDVVRSDVVLVTLGSPIDSLYSRYLDYIAGSEGDVHSVSRWLNCYRSGDYVGGPIERADTNDNIGAGGHIGYWSAPEFAEHMVQMHVAPISRANGSSRSKPP